MPKYLVVHFDRYNTEESTHTHVESESPKHAILAVLAAGETDEDELAEMEEFVDDELTTVDEVFNCISGEEDDWLVYLV